MTVISVARRAGSAVLVLLVVAALVFAATEAAPGDAATVRSGPAADPAAVAALREELGLDRSAPERFVAWLGDLLRGDLGTSFANGRPVGELLGERVAASAVLGGIAVVLLLPLAVGLGVLTGLRPHRRPDRVISSVALALVSVPEFVTGALLALVFAVHLGWLPAVSLLPPGASPLAHPQTLVLPVVTLLAVCLAQNMRLVRAGVAEAARSDAVESARLNGVAERRVVLRHILPVAVVPALPIMARYVSYLLGGALVAETLFGYPGIASALVQAAVNRDAPVVQAVTMLVAALTVGLNLAADALTRLLSPAEPS